ncbi:MAG: hypothetical protein R3F55_06325 [Alphaproteobacteria bacterium]
MRIAGGVIAIIVGIIQTILTALLVFGTQMIDEAMQSAEGQQAIADAAGGDAEAAAAMTSEVVSTLGWVAWVALIVSIIVVVLGIMICASKNPVNGIIVAIIGIVLLVLSLIQGGDVLLPIIWNGLIILAGVLGYMGAKKDSGMAAA